ncbi:MAG TPA: hypothetical protein PLD25_23550 [Chloroflexota bacterium]|nr:hypothetical protein [Chloroflexota bacterium]HUM67487.1 hypothetical protein [Chloroflexota bacterium]
MTLGIGEIPPGGDNCGNDQQCIAHHYSIHYPHINKSHKFQNSDAVKCQEAKKAKIEQKAGKLKPAYHL